MPKRAQVRYVLSRAWAKGPQVCWIMLNPSSADDKKDDPTIRSCIKHSKRLGFGSLIVVNLYPFRTASPRECQEIAEEDYGAALRYWDELGTNQDIIQDEAQTADKVIAAWGQSTWDDNWIDEMVDGIRPLYCLGTTKSGAPKHPLARGRHRISDTQPLVVWQDTRLVPQASEQGQQELMLP